MKTPDDIKKGLECCRKGNCKGCPYKEGEYIDCQEQLEKDALAYIEQLEAQMPMWISVKAGLPKAYRNVDVIFGSHDGIGYYAPMDKKWFDSHGIPIYGITHWKYRDEPPKEG